MQFYVGKGHRDDDRLAKIARCDLASFPSLPLPDQAGVVSQLLLHVHEHDDDDGLCPVQRHPGIKVMFRHRLISLCVVSLARPCVGLGQPINFGCLRLQQALVPRPQARPAAHRTRLRVCSSQGAWSGHPGGMKHELRRPARLRAYSPRRRSVHLVPSLPSLVSASFGLLRDPGQVVRVAACDGSR